MRNGKTNEKINFSTWWSLAISHRYRGQQEQQDTTEQASLAQQAEPIFSPANPKIVALCSTKRLRMPIALSPTENGMTTTKRGQATR